MWELFSSAGSIAVVILAFSALIFVHELGHFLAALLVGVRPERFFIGFDIYGLGLKKEYKGCVYGIGLLPLGGYVKLAGQSDDPREQKVGTGAPDDYNSKPLWAQATIIVAGVVMNMIFGFLLLFGAYLYGLPQVPPVVGQVIEGTPAALADIRPRDRVLSVNGQKADSMGMVQEFIVMNPNDFANLEIDRGGEVIHRRLKAISGQLGLRGTGILPPADAKVAEVDDLQPYAKEYQEILRKGDVFLEVDGKKVPAGFGSGDVLAGEMIRQNPGRTLPAVVLRDGAQVKIQLPVLGAGNYDFGYAANIKVAGTQDGSPAQQAGLQDGDMITGLVIDGKTVNLLNSGDLSDQIQGRAYQPVELTIQRGGQEQKLTVKPRYLGGLPEVSAGADTLLGVTVETVKNAQGQAGGWQVKTVLADGPTAGMLQPGDRLLAVSGQKTISFAKTGADAAEYYAHPENVGKAVAVACCKEVGVMLAGRDKPLMLAPQLTLDTGVPMIGIVMDPYIRVGKVTPGTPAAAFLTPGDKIVWQYISPDGRTTKVGHVGPDDSAREPAVFKTPEEIVQKLQAGQAVGQVEGGANIVFAPSKGVKKSAGVGGALGLAYHRSVDMSLMVYKMLHRLATRQIAVSNMSGPLGIYMVMKDTTESPDPLMNMIFLMALISINLAVFNLLPFPVLDGGHLLFIAIHWLKGSPASERLREISQYFGILCLLSLMVFVTYNDVFRWWSSSSAEKVVKNAAGKDK